MSRRQIRESLSLTGKEHFRVAYLKPALEIGLIEMTLPDKPKSRAQRYRLTPLGQHWLKDQSNTGETNSYEGWWLTMPTTADFIFPTCALLGQSVWQILPNIGQSAKLPP
jgi:hypothetical protein